MITLEHVIEVALLVLVAYLVGCVIGYASHLAVRAHGARPRFAPAIQEAAAAPPPASVAPARRSAARRLAGAVDRQVVPATDPVAQQHPPSLPAPRSGKADDLRKIKGIGPKTESALNDLGIYHYDQVAAWMPAHIDWLEGRIAVKGRIRREQWVEQAILLATATTPA